MDDVTNRCIGFLKLSWQMTTHWGRLREQFDSLTAEICVRRAVLPVKTPGKHTSLPFLASGGCCHSYTIAGCVGPTCLWLCCHMCAPVSLCPNPPLLSFITTQVTGWRPTLIGSDRILTWFDLIVPVKTSFQMRSYLPTLRVKTWI